MHILRVNLKHFYQRRGLWLLYPIYGVLMFALATAVLSERALGKGSFTALLVPAFLVGQIVGMMQMEVLSRPFSFCLPGHRGMVRQLVFLVGVAASAVLAVPFLWYPDLAIAAPAWLAVVFLSGFSANLVVYLTGVTIAVSVRNAMAVIGLVIFAAVVLSRLEGGAALERAIFYRPGLVTVVAGVATAAGWLWLGRPAWFRSRCATPWVGLFDPWDHSKMYKFRHVRADRRLPKASYPGIDEFFLRTIGRYAESDPRRYVWGVLYTTSSLILPQWKGLLFVVLMAVVWTGYSPRVAPFVVAIVPLMVAGFINPPLYSKLSVAGGRRERSLATMIQMLALAAVSTLAVGLSVLVLNLVEPFVPRFAVADFELNLQPVDFKVVLLPLMAFPIMGLLRVLFHRNPMWQVSAMMLLFVGVMFLSMFVRSVAPMVAVAVDTVLWAICLLTVHRVAMHGDLAGR